MEAGIIIGAVIGFAGTGGVGWLAGKRDDRLREEDRKDAKRAELKAAMANYLAAIDALTLELPNDPPPTEPLAIDKWIMKMAKITGIDFVGFILARFLHRAMYGKRPAELADRLADAASYLRLIAPPEVEQYMIEGQALSQEYKPHDKQWVEGWDEFRKRMRAGFRAALDQLDAQ